MSTHYDYETEIYVCGLCHNFSSEEWGDVAEHRETWHTDMHTDYDY